MKINKAQLENIQGGIKKDELKKVRPAEVSKNETGDEHFVLNETRPKNLKNYTTTQEKSESLLTDVQKGLSDLNFNAENLFSNFNTDNIFALLKESN